ncbi:hypothetical protein TEA_024020 [Camellia sinensis var. sinensis]|uniref:biotin carboxylase n=1 Tax=Camellia sinensis var. sinensis TaxID=542762 RepID=A0A4S4EFB5_CAMSN|nr:hypothetical protein TEA_024020 [Camellia sinensis var. sinensis]
MDSALTFCKSVHSTPGLFVGRSRGIQSPQCSIMVGSRVNFPRQRVRVAQISRKSVKRGGALCATCRDEKILVANRGEIAVRIIRTAHEMGIPCVAVYSTIDKDALHVKLADESVCIGEAPSSQSGGQLPLVVKNKVVSLASVTLAFVGTRLVNAVFMASLHFIHFWFKIYWYLVIPNVLSAAISRGCTMLHPGYGFLAENAVFVEMCREHGINFIGPNPDSIRVMGDKATARETMKNAGVPTVPGSEGLLQNTEEAVRLSEEIGFPVMIKATAGGGGRGMRLAKEPDEFVKLLQVFLFLEVTFELLMRKHELLQAKSEAAAAFGNDGVYLEKYIQNPRHIEFQKMTATQGIDAGYIDYNGKFCARTWSNNDVNHLIAYKLLHSLLNLIVALSQIPNPIYLRFTSGAPFALQVLADKFGNVVHFGERDCSIQRRNQKLLEEAPSPALTPELRKAMGDAAVAAAASIGYIGVGTVEFLLDERGSFYFMEMNTRIQVEHPVTEMISSVDLIEEQIRVAMGEKLRYKQVLKMRCLEYSGHKLQLAAAYG